MYVGTLGERPGTDEEAEASAAASRRAAAEWYQKYQADCQSFLKIRPSWTSVRACGLKPGCSPTLRSSDAASRNWLERQTHYRQKRTTSNWQGFLQGWGIRLPTDFGL